jgi:hydrogenase nickel incorporation protein HypB
MDYFRQGVEMLNPGLITFPLSAKTGEGMAGWIEWLSQQVEQVKQAK